MWFEKAELQGMSHAAWPMDGSHICHVFSIELFYDLVKG